MIDFASMKVGDVADLPHKTVWEGSNQAEYDRAQAYASSTEPQPQFEVRQNLHPNGKPADGFTIRRVR